MDSPERFCLTYETLSPLVSFRCLRKLVIALNNLILIDDNELGTLARSWPLIEVLQLNCRSGGWPWETADYPTLCGLLAVIAACPQHSPQAFAGSEIRECLCADVGICVVGGGYGASDGMSTNVG